MPPDLKRGRDEDEGRTSSSDSGEKRRRVAGPAPPPPRVAGPTLPPTSDSRSSSPESDLGPAPPSPPKPKRVAGPAMPPAPLDERPPNPPSDDSDSSDDDFGPAPPPAGAQPSAYGYENNEPAPSAFDTDPQYTEQPKKVERDAWMTMPPTQDDLAARMDPTKLRARKFNTGKSAGAPAGGGMGVWTETPEQKLKRLQNEALGISAPSNSSDKPHPHRRAVLDVLPAGLQQLRCREPRAGGLQGSSQRRLPSRTSVRMALRYLWQRESEGDVGPA